MTTPEPDPFADFEAATPNDPSASTSAVEADERIDQADEIDRVISEYQAVLQAGERDIVEVFVASSINDKSYVEGGRREQLSEKEEIEAVRRGRKAAAWYLKHSFFAQLQKPANKTAEPVPPRPALSEEGRSLVQRIQQSAYRPVKKRATKADKVPLDPIVDFVQLALRYTDLQRGLKGQKKLTDDEFLRMAATWQRLDKTVLAKAYHDYVKKLAEAEEAAKEIRLMNVYVRKRLD